MALVTGMRPSEPFGLCSEDVDLKIGIIRIRNSVVRDKEGGRPREPKTDRGKQSIRMALHTLHVLQTCKVGQATELIEAGGA